MLLQDAKILIAEIEKTGYKYTTFEIPFIETLKSRKVQLSPKQSKWLQQMYEKAVEGGILWKKEYGKKGSWK